MSESSGLGNLTNWVRCASGNGFYVKRLQPKLLFSQGGGAVITSVYKMYFINYWFIDFAEIYHEAFGSFRFFSVVNSERDLNAIY